MATTKVKEDAKDKGSKVSKLGATKAKNESAKSVSSKVKK